MSERETVPASLHEVPDSGAPRSAGQMLRELRESAGVDPALLASAMKVSTQKLDALENDRLDLLPDGGRQRRRLRGDAVRRARDVHCPEQRAVRRVGHRGRGTRPVVNTLVEMLDAKNFRRLP